MTGTDSSKKPAAFWILGGLFLLVGIAALGGSLFTWGNGFILAAPPGTDLAFPITDILVNGPASILLALGLFRARPWAWSLLCFVAGFYVYASVEIFVRMFQAGPPYQLEILVPQIFAIALAVAALLVLRRHREAGRLSRER